MNIRTVHVLLVAVLLLLGLPASPATADDHCRQLWIFKLCSRTSTPPLPSPSPTNEVALPEDEPGWTQLPSHPWAANYPSSGGNTYHEDGSALVDLEDHRGHLYAGYGTTYGGSGPCEGCNTTVAYFDGTRWVAGLDSFQSEGIWVYRHVGRGISTVALDNKGSVGFATGEPWQQFGPGTRRTGDVAEYKGALYLVGAASGPKVWRSTDGGSSWTVAFTHNHPEGMFCGAGVMDGKLYVFEGDWYHCHNLSPYDDVFVFDGSSWTYAARDHEGHWKPTPWDGSLVLLETAANQGPPYLLRYNGGGASWRIRSDTVDFAVDGDFLFALTNDARVMRYEAGSCTLTCWQQVAETPGQMTSIEVSNGVMHVGGIQGQLWRYDGDPYRDTSGVTGTCLWGTCP